MGSKGKCVTVLGDVCPSSLGRTLTHEHLSMQFEVVYQQPKEPNLAHLPWTLQNSGWIRQNPYSHRDNIILNDKSSGQAILSSVHKFASLGGGCIVENSTLGLDRDTSFLRQVSLDTGVKVIAGTGFYVGPAQTAATRAMRAEDMAEHMQKELLEGCLDLPMVRAGFIGEIGCSFPLQDVEKKAIVASAAAQTTAGCAVSFHPGRHHTCPEEIMRLFMEAGGRADKCIMSHVERTLLEDSQLLDLASYCEVILQFDLFGIENSYYQLEESIDFPSDAQRIDKIVMLVEEGHVDRVLLSHDIHTKHRLEAFGGHGFSHLLENAIPKMIRSKGIQQDHIDKFLISNPAKVFTMF